MSSYTQFPLIVPSKTCKKCGESKPLTQFGAYRAAPDGLQRYCRDCLSSWRREYREANRAELSAKWRDYYQANRESRIEKQAVYRAAHLAQYRASDAAYRAANRESISQTKAAHYQAHRTQLNEAQKRRARTRKDERKVYAAGYYASNREKVKASANLFRISNPEHVRTYRSRRRARVRGVRINDLTIQQWQEILAYFDYRCAYCGVRPRRITLDHMQPISRGGNHTASNVVPACVSCNCSKGDKTLAEYIGYRSLLDFSRCRESPNVPGAGVDGESVTPRPNGPVTI